MSDYTIDLTKYYILLSLIEPRHGYSIIENVRQLSDNQIQMAVGDVFSNLEDLTHQQLINTIDSPTDSRRREYIITDKGLTFLQEQYSDLSRILTISQSLLTATNNSNEYEFY